MDKKITEYYKKAQRLIDETDGALLTYQEHEGDKVVTNTLVNPPDKTMDILQMFRSSYIACKMLLESQPSEEVKKFGADAMLRTIITLDEPDNIHKAIITKFKKE